MKKVLGFLLLIALFFLNILSSLLAEEDQKEWAVTFGIIHTSQQPLDSLAYEKLLLLKEELEQKRYQVIFNGIGAEGIDFQEDQTGFWLNPRGLSIETTQALQIITKEQMDIDVLLKGASQEEGDLLRIVYQAGAQASWGDVVGDIQKYLQLKVDQGVLQSFEFLEYTHEIELTYPNDPLIKAFAPLWTIKQIRYLLDTFGDPLKYAQSVFNEYQQRINDGEILVVYQQDGQTEHFFMSLEEIKMKIEEIEKLFQSNKQQDNQEKEQSVLNSFFNFFKRLAFLMGETSVWAQENPSVLNDVTGTIVPGAKNVVMLEAPDYIVMRAFGKQYANGAHLKSQSRGFFSSLTDNGYNISFQGSGWNEPFVEKLEQVLLDENVQIVLFHTHGGKEILLAEVWTLGTNIKIDAPTLERERFLNRLNELQAKYGEKSLYGREIRSQLDQEDADRLLSQSAGFPDKVKAWIKEPTMLGSIRLRSEFFKASKFKEKALFILYACYGGSLADAINARVVLASKPEQQTMGIIFFADLKKVFSCLAKEKSCPLIERMDKLKNHRNTNIISLFDQKQFAINDEQGNPIDVVLERKLVKECNAKIDALCSLQWYGKDENPVAISAHVEEVSGRKIVFNVPMDGKENPEEVVTLDYSRCGDVQNEILDKKPNWEDERSIVLPWEDVVYREWQDTDFDEYGRPKVDFAILTVHSNKALSAISKIPLTGNPEACTDQGCLQPEAWKDPSAVKFNGNHADTSFVFTKPCLKKEYYSPCHQDAGGLVVIKDNQGEQGSFLMPQYVRINGECYRRVKPQNPKDAVEAVDWEKAEDCLSVCQEGQDCFSHIFERGFVQDDQAITYINQDGKTYQADEVRTLFLNGKEIEDCREKRIYNNVTEKEYTSWCAEPNAFGKHFAWIKIMVESNQASVVESSVSKYEVYYDGELYDTAQENETIQNLMLYKQGVYYLKSISNRSHVFYNKKDYGDLRALSANNYFLDLPEMKLDLSDYQTGDLNFFYRLPEDPPQKPVFDERLIPARVEASHKLAEVTRKECFAWHGDVSISCLKDAESRACGVPDPTSGIEHDEEYCAGALIDAEFIGYVDGSPMWATHLKGEPEPYSGLLNWMVEKIPTEKRIRAFYWERKYVPLDEQDQFEEDTQELSLTLADVVKRDFALYVGQAVYWNGEKRYDCANGCWGTRVFGEHLAFVNRNDQVVYDGKSLAKIDSEVPILYQDHIGFYIHADDPLVSHLPNSKDYVYIDGHIYDRDSSMLVNLYTCRQEHLE